MSDQKASNQVALAMLVAGKIFGVVGLAVGATSYRALGGTLLGIDGLLLLFAAVFAVRNMKKQATEEKDHKAVLEQMMREGTLNQYLRDIRANEATNA